MEVKKSVFIVKASTNAESIGNHHPQAPKIGSPFTLRNGQKGRVVGSRRATDGSMLVAVQVQIRDPRRGAYMATRWVRAVGSELGTRQNRVRTPTPEEAAARIEQAQRQARVQQAANFFETDYRGNDVMGNSPEVAAKMTSPTHEAVSTQRALREKEYRQRNAGQVALNPYEERLEEKRPRKVTLRDEYKKFLNPNFRENEPESQFNIKYYDSFEHQVRGAERILTELKNKDGVLLGDDPGLGKTTTAYLTLKQYVADNPDAKRILIVVPTNGRKNLIKSWTNEAKSHGLEIANNKNGYTTNFTEKDKGIFIISYSDLDKVDAQSFDFGIFDECHNMANAKTQQAQRAAKVRSSTKKLLYMSATPFTEVEDMAYLDRTGFVEKMGGWAEFKKKFKYRAKANESEESVSLNQTLLLQKLNTAFTMGGYGFKRETNLEGLNTFIGQVQLTASERAIYNKVERFFHDCRDRVKGGVKKMQLGAMFQGWYRHYLEYVKIPTAVALAKQAIAEGKQPGLFTAYNIGGHSHLFAMINATMAYMIKEKIDTKEFQVLADRVLRELPVIPPITTELTKRLGGPDAVAEVHGQTRGKNSVEEAADFQEGRKKVLVASMAKGGTGLSFHDQRGDAPRVQINLTVPYSDKQYAQVVGRMHRLTKTKRNSELYWLGCDTEGDKRLNQIIGQRMLKAGAAVMGNQFQNPAASSFTLGGGQMFSMDRETSSFERVDSHAAREFYANNYLQQFEENLSQSFADVAATEMRRRAPRARRRQAE